MPELPDVEAYLAAIRQRLRGEPLRALRLESPFLLRTVEPPIEALVGRPLVGARRLGKRVVLEFEGQHFAVLHLMVAGRLRWRAPGAKSPGRIVQASLEFDPGTLHVTEAGSKRRASLHVVAGEQDLAAHDPGGLEPLEATPQTFAAALARENRTLKLALCDPRLFSGIGNAYSDEILHAARLSPFRLTSKLSPEESERLFDHTVAVLTDWSERLASELKSGFPEKVTAFKQGMTAHGRFREACPACAASIQRIVHKTNETNYCPGCQTGGQILADRALSRLLKDDFPKHLDEL